jgi:hypothetical protein
MRRERGIQIRNKGTPNQKREARERKPGAAGSHTWFPSLRETHENSNFLLLRIPLEIHNCVRGQKAFSISDRYLPSAMPPSQTAIARLLECGFVRSPGSRGRPTEPE